MTNVSERLKPTPQAARYAPALRAGYSNPLSPEDSDADSSVNGNDSVYDDDGMSVSSEPLAECTLMSPLGRGVPAFVGGGTGIPVGGMGGSASECTSPTEGASPIAGTKPKKEWKLEIWRRASKAARAQVGVCFKKEFRSVRWATNFYFSCAEIVLRVWCASR